MTPRRASRNFVKIPIDKKDVVRNIATSQIKIKSFLKWHFFSNFDGMANIHDRYNQENFGINIL